jgi:hypothetical protein
MVDLTRLKALEEHLEDADFLDTWEGVHRQNKQRLADLIKERTGVEVDAEAIGVDQIEEFEHRFRILGVVELGFETDVDAVPLGGRHDSRQRVLDGVERLLAVHELGLRSFGGVDGLCVQVVRPPNPLAQPLHRRFGFHQRRV